MTTAGTGTRVSKFSQGLNKGLLTLANKPVFAHVLDKFPKNIPVVIVLGYQGQIVKECIEALYPERNLQFVVVDKFEGQDSGLGRSIIAAKDFLQCPFVFTPNDCFPEKVDWNIDPNRIGNWLFAVPSRAIDKSIVSEYRGLSENHGFLDQLFVQGYPSELVYSGLTGIKDFEDFWQKMEAESDLSIGESTALREMNQVSVLKGDEWVDVGNEKSLAHAEEKFNSRSEINVLKKDNETIWFTSGLVTKVFR